MILNLESKGTNQNGQVVSDVKWEWPVATHEKVMGLAEEGEVAGMIAEENCHVREPTLMEVCLFIQMLD